MLRPRNLTFSPLPQATRELASSFGLVLLSLGQPQRKAERRQAHGLDPTSRAAASPLARATSLSSRTIPSILTTHLSSPHHSSPLTHNPPTLTLHHTTYP